jgi:glutamate racemase
LNGDWTGSQSISQPGDRPIGVFDSGIGGLTVVRELLGRFPQKGIAYFGDTARVPYGTKSATTVRRFSVENTRFLINQGVHLVVVACNTSSAVALDMLRRQFEIPILGVVEPGARAAVAASRSGRIGVIGTYATIASGAYEKAIHALEPNAEVHAVSCPLFVPLAEEGWTDHPVTREVAREYLAPLKNAHIDTLVLGCTHYGVLRQGIESAFNDEKVVLVDSAAEVAREVGEHLEAAASSGGAGGLSGASSGGTSSATSSRGTSSATATDHYRFYVSDIPARFREVGGRFLGRPLDEVVLIDQTDLPWFERTLEMTVNGRLSPTPPPVQT